MVFLFFFILLVFPQPEDALMALWQESHWVAYSESNCYSGYFKLAFWRPSYAGSSQASSVSIVSGYKMDHRAIQARYSAEAKDFSSSLCAQNGPAALGSRWRWVVSVFPRPRFSPRERTPGTHWIGGWVGPKAGLDTEDRILCLCRRSNLDRSVVQFEARHYTDWAARAHHTHVQ
jgi:hypothetical protein